MVFDEELFPEDISRGATSRARRLVDVVTLRSGFEQVNAVWTHSRRTYDVGLGLRHMQDVYEVIEFWEARRGRLRAFRFKDWSDFKSKGPNSTPADTDQTMGILSATTFQLRKVYSPLSNPYTREVKKPINGTVVIRDDTGALTEGADWAMDYTTGIATFTSEPTGTPTAGFEFHVPVRFEAEELEINVELFDVGSIPIMNLTEIRI